MFTLMRKETEAETRKKGKTFSMSVYKTSQELSTSTMKTWLDSLLLSERRRLT